MIRYDAVPNPSRAMTHIDPDTTLPTQGHRSTQGGRSVNETDRLWHEWRKGGIGASEIGAIAGLPGSYGSRYAIWAEKVGLVEPVEPDDREATDKMRFGHDIELMLPTVASREAGIELIRQQVWQTHPENPIIRATLDGEGIHQYDVERDRTGGGELVNVECKLATLGAWKAPEHDPTGSPIPYGYQAQAQWQMLASGRDRTCFIVLHGWRWATHWIDANPEDQGFLLFAAEKFWNEHVLTGVPPEVDGSDDTTAAITARHRPVHDEELVDVDVSLLRRWVQAKADLRAAKVAEAEASNALREAMGQATEAMCRGRHIATWRLGERGEIDTKRLAAELPEIAQQYRKTTEVRTLRARDKQIDELMTELETVP